MNSLLVLVFGGHSNFVAVKENDPNFPTSSEPPKTNLDQCYFEYKNTHPCRKYTRRDQINIPVVFSCFSYSLSEYGNVQTLYTFTVDHEYYYDWGRCR